MAVVVAEIPTEENAAIGADGDLLIVGDSFDRSYLWEDFEDGTAADFTGYVPTGEVVDSSGTVLVTLTVTPSPGDTTGTFRVQATATNTTTLGASANTWRLRITLGAVTRTLICAPFTVSSCP